MPLYQIFILSRMLLIWVINLCSSLSVREILVSSAYKIKNASFDIKCKSFMYIRNKRGPRMKPCGTPHCMYWWEVFTFEKCSSLQWSHINQPIYKWIISLIGTENEVEPCWGLYNMFLTWRLNRFLHWPAHMSLVCLCSSVTAWHVTHIWLQKNTYWYLFIECWQNRTHLIRRNKSNMKTNQ